MGGGVTTYRQRPFLLDVDPGAHENVLGSEPVEVSVGNGVLSLLMRMQQALPVRRVTCVLFVELYHRSRMR